MSDVIDLNLERDRRDGPDAEFVLKEAFGRKLFAFSLEYEMAGRRWAATIWAGSMQDAEAHVEAMKLSLVVMGQTFSERDA